MNKTDLFSLIPIYRQQLYISKKKETILKKLKEITSQNSTAQLPFTGVISNDQFKIFKTNTSLNVKSELVFHGKVAGDQNTTIDITGRFKIIPTIWYLVLISLFMIASWFSKNYFTIIIPIIPYLFMLFKVKVKSKKIIKELEYSLLY